MTNALTRREAWLAERKTLITGTDAAKIAGVSPFGGAIDVYQEKLGLEPEIIIEPRRAHQLEAGKRFEQAILQWFADDQNVPIAFTDGYTVMKSLIYSRIGATLDARRTDSEPNPPVDAKNLNIYAKGWGEPGTDEMPAYYAAQLVFQMHVTNAPFADIAVVFGGQRLAVYRLHRDQGLEDDLVGRCQSFYENHVLAQVPPAVDGSKSYSEFLQRLVVKQTEREIDATAELQAAALELARVRDQIKHLEGEKDFHEQILKLAIAKAEAKSIIAPNWKASWGMIEDSKGVDWQKITTALAAQYVTPPDRMADLIKANTIVTKKGSRRFTFNFKDAK